ncbi:Alanyl-tRNA synthetase, class IIc, N-terminal, partial [Dillenia turbinata]
MDSSSSNPTKLEYYDDMCSLPIQLVHLKQAEDGRRAVILESTIFHPQGGGQPSDTGFITFPNSNSKFVVQDVRSKDGIVFHYGSLENEDSNSNSNEELLISEIQQGIQVSLHVNEPRRTLNSRLHSAGHLLDVCVLNVGLLTHLEPNKGYHFPDGPFVEYKGTIPSDLQTKQKELELEANALISRGGKISAALVPYEEALKLCGGCLPDYIPKGSTPRIIKIGDNPGCPCGGTHVHDISEIISMK